MDHAYEGHETRALVKDLGLVPVLPPKSNRKQPWPYDKEQYCKRNEVERLFRCLKDYRRIATRYDKLDVVFRFFILLALIVEALRLVVRVNGVLGEILNSQSGGHRLATDWTGWRGTPNR